MQPNRNETISDAQRLSHSLNLVEKDAGARTFLLEMLPKHSVGAEIGVHMGDFSRQILDVVFPAELHLIDPWEYQPSGTYERAWYGGKAEGGQQEMDVRYAHVCKRFAGEVRARRLHVHRAYSTEALHLFPDGAFDWVYIDGNHLYEYVRADLELSLRKTRRGGLITGDDYTGGGWWQGGVKKAVDEFVAGDAGELVEIRNRQFILRKR